MMQPLLVEIEYFIRRRPTPIILCGLAASFLLAVVLAC